MQLDKQMESMILRLWRETEAAGAPLALVLQDAAEALLAALDAVAFRERGGRFDPPPPISR